eukprot:104873_1
MITLTRLFKCFFAIILIFTVTSIVIGFNYQFRHTHLQNFIQSGSEESAPCPCLVIIWGLTRGWQATYQSQFDHLLDRYQCDLALSVGTKGENTSNPFYQRAKYIWIHNFDDIGYEKGIEEYYYEQTPNNESYTKWLSKYLQFKNDTHVTQFMGPLWSTQGMESRGTSGIGIVTRYFTALNVLKHNLTSKYKAIAYTRCDFKYMCDHDWEPFEYVANHSDERVVWIPNGRGWGGIYDRHFVSTPHMFITINSLLQDMILDEQLLNELRSKRKNWNSEELMMLQINRNRISINRYDPSMYLVRENTTPTGWSHGTRYDAKEGIWIKYETEYANAFKYCTNQTYQYSEKFLSRAANQKYVLTHPS